MPPHTPQSPQERAGLEIARRLRAAGHETYWAGGWTRDYLLGLPPADVDIATGARPEDIARLFEKTVFVGAKFGVCRVTLEGATLEAATFRREGAYSDHRRPDSVEFATAEEDARRRDFTINAIFYDPLDGALVDWTGGRADLQARRLRCVGDPDRRFAEDALRILRAIRFAAALDFEIEPATWNALRAHAPELEWISAERSRDELVKIFRGPRPARALDLLLESGALELLLPEVAAMRGVEQPPQYHPEGDVWTHTKLCLEALPPGRSATLAFAALLHDVGKPPTFTRAPDRIRFHGHDSEGAKIADAILRRLKFPTSEREAVVAIVRRHMQFLSLPEMRPARAARFLAGPFIEEELALHRADCLASNGDLSTLEFARRRLEEARARWQAPLPPPLLRGDDLLALGYRRGPRIGHILRALQERQIEGALHNTKEARTWVLQAFPLETSPA